MKRFPVSLLSLFSLVLLLQGCDTTAVNDPPGVDVQAPTISFLAPASTDSLGVGIVDVSLRVTDNDDIDKVLLYLDGMVFDTLFAEPWESSFLAAPLDEGSHVLSATAFDRTGNSATAKLTMRKGDGQTGEVLRVSLVEIVTSANCQPCGPQNETYHNGTQGSPYTERVATIKYHVWWPFSTDQLWHQSSEWVQPRVEYLFNPIPAAQYGAPNGWVAGEKINNKALDWIASADVDMQLSAGARIILQTSQSGNTIDLTIRVTGISTSEYSDLRLHTAVTESEIEYNDGNAENIHYDVLRRMYPDAQGESVNIANGQTVVFTRSITVEDFWNADHLQAVVFLQSKGSKYVLQAAKLDL